MSAPKHNKFALGNSGKSKTFTSPKKLEACISEYFNWCTDNPIRVVNGNYEGVPIYVDTVRPYTIEGLAEYLETTRQTLLNYQKEAGYEEYFDIITRAKEKVTRQRIEMGTVGVFKERFTKFLLINNTDYVDKVEQKTTNHNINHNVVLTPEEAREYDKALENDY